MISFREHSTWHRVPAFLRREDIDPESGWVCIERCSPSDLDSLEPLTTRNWCQASRAGVRQAVFVASRRA